MKRNRDSGNRNFYGAVEMRVCNTNPPHLLTDGLLKDARLQQGGDYPCLVVEMMVAGSDPVEVTLDVVDLNTIVRLAKESTFREIQDAVRWP